MEGLLDSRFLFRCDGGGFTCRPLASQLLLPLLRLCAGCHALGQINLLVGGQQRHLADFLEVHPHRVINGEVPHQRVGVHQLLFLHIGDLLCCRTVVGQLRKNILVGADINVQGLQGIVELIHLVTLQVQVVQRLRQLTGVQLALSLSLIQQLPQLFIAGQPCGGGQCSHLLVIQPEDAGFLCLLVGHDGGRLAGDLLTILSGFSRFFRLGLRLGGKQGVGLLLQQFLPSQFFLLSHVAFLRCFFSDL
ncbi:hypothetical protein SDC9_133601 [bioreactor metagenome]|uniref:Uncharacterized protein n=1 Tax=bioreactor metagenome TaxID=1076179 RepID=A0A645DD77_9ZZZZ